MKNYSFKPTEENALRLLKENPIGRNTHVFRFISLLSNMEDDCYSVALNGEWGAGKTLFIKQVKLLLDAHNPLSSVSADTRSAVEALDTQGHICHTNYTTVYYDAWANDNHVDPILSLIYATIANSQSKFNLERKRSVGEAAASIVDAVAGHNIANILKSWHGEDRLEIIKETERVKELVENFIDELIVEHGDRLIFFVDELDRCKPDYALFLLERIKHFFDDERVTFVFAVNLSQLVCTVKGYYGSTIDATRYLDKFFDLHVALPHVNYKEYIQYQLSLTANTIIDDLCIETAKYFNFSLRETERYIRLYKIVRKELEKESIVISDRYGKAFAICFFVPVMLGLQMSDAIGYAKFMAGKDCEALLEILSNLSLKKYVQWLCNHNEKYDDDRKLFTDDNGNAINLSERLREIYYAVFVQLRKDRYHDIHIGNLCFSPSTLNSIEESVSLLSQNLDYEFK